MQQKHVHTSIALRALNSQLSLQHHFAGSSLGSEQAAQRHLPHFEQMMDEWPSPATPLSPPAAPPPPPPPPPPASSLSGGDFDGCVDITPLPFPPLVTLPPLPTPPLPKVVVVVRWLVRQGRLTVWPLPATVGAGLGGREEFSPMWEDLSGRMGNGRGLSTYSLIARGPHRTCAKVTIADD